GRDMATPLQPFEGQRMDPGLQATIDAERARRAAAELEIARPARSAAAYAALAERSPAKAPRGSRAFVPKPAAEAAPAPASAPPVAPAKAEPPKAVKAKAVSKQRTAAKAAPKAAKPAPEPVKPAPEPQKPAAPAEPPKRKTLTLPAKKPAKKPAEAPAKPEPKTEAKPAAAVPSLPKGQRGPVHRAAVLAAEPLRRERWELDLVGSKKTAAQKKRQAAVEAEIQRRLEIPADVVIDIPPGGTPTERYNAVLKAAQAEGYGFEGATQLAERQVPRQTAEAVTEAINKAEADVQADTAVANRKQKAASILKPGRREMPVDANGLPADRLPRIQGAPTAEQRHATDAYEQLDNVGEPDHPLITPAETPHDTMARAKEIVADGQAGDISGFVDAAFLDDLATVTTGVK